MAERAAPSSVTEIAPPSSVSKAIRLGSLIVMAVLFVCLVSFSSTGTQSLRATSLLSRLQSYGLKNKLQANSIMQLSTVENNVDSEQAEKDLWADQMMSMIQLDAEPLVVGRHSNKAAADWVDKHKDIDDIVARAAAKSVAKKESDPFAKNNIDEIVARATFRSVAKFQDDDTIGDVDENELKYAAQLAAKSVAVNANRLANYVDVPKTELADAIGKTTTIAVGKNAPVEKEEEPQEDSYVSGSGYAYESYYGSSAGYAYDYAYYDYAYDYGSAYYDYGS